MAGLTIQVETTGTNEDVVLPATDNGTFNATVYWGDTTNSTIATYDDADLTHTYVSAGTYEIEITGAFPGFSFNNGGDRLKVTDIIDWGDPADFDGFQYFASGFYGCDNMVSLGTGSIQMDGATDLSRTFLECGSLTGTVHSDLFDNCGGVTTLYFMCRATAVTGVASGALDAFTNVVRCDALFMSASLTGPLPSLIFEQMTSCTNFFRMLRDNPNLQYTEDLFYAQGDKDTRFLNQSINWGECFSLASFTGTQGTAPDLFNCDHGTGTPTNTTTAYNGHSVTTIDNWKNVPGAADAVDWGGDAVSAPTITDVDGDETISTDQTNVAWTGANNLPYQYDAFFELTTSATPGAGTRVQQTIVDWSDTGGHFDVVQGGLSAGTVYGHITTDRGDVVATGITLTLESAGNAFTSDGDLPVPAGAATFDQKNTMSAAGTLSFVTGSATFENTAANEFTAAGVLPVVEADADFSQANPMTAAGELPLVEASASFEQANPFTVAGVLPLIIGAAPFEQANPMVAAAELPVPVAAATFENLGENSFTAEGVMPLPEGLATFEQVNDFLVSGDLPLVEGAATFGNATVNAFTGDGVLPALLGAGTFSQANVFGAAGSLPALVGSADFAQANNLTAAGVLALLVGSATFENTAKNPFTAAGTLPLLEGAGLFEQVNELIAAGTLPLIIGGATFENPAPGVTIYVPVIVDASVMGGAPTVTIPGLNDFQQLLYVDDLANAFFNNSEFAIQVQYFHSSLNVWKTYSVIFDDPQATAKVAEGEFNTLRPQFQISEAVLTHRMLKQDKCRVRGKLHYIDDHVSDGVGVTTAFLRLK